jgi:hypothetical protein
MTMKRDAEAGDWAVTEVIEDLQWTAEEWQGVQVQVSPVLAKHLNTTEAEGWRLMAVEGGRFFWRREVQAGE